ncbi:sulfatase-like hydrolase/transferase [Rudanella paleaurantiibacter]|uniref:Sulfatase-like hydrolase/transferase n=1 Tax=Rudanella paleaurantiibacter TaxID=2614655 RepID=A0A7J5TRX4_9BACT|nr:sulfatase-like hydrolase/transferase [Rudanella paleaurantiibacter]
MLVMVNKQANVMWIRTLILCGYLLLAASTAARPSTPPLKRKPNIIFILTDDLGYGDLGVLYQNSRQSTGKPNLHTPHLDNMARQGMLLTRHYVPAPVCAPSRASLMLGVHQGHANIRNNQFDKALADNHTIASVLKQAGYATALVGKWGLQGLQGDSPQTWEAYPTKRGFDYFLGYVRHRDGHNHYPAHQARERPPVELYHGQEEISRKLQGVYTADLFTATAKRWITTQNQTRKEQPFFLYLAYDTPHASLQVPAKAYPQGGGLKGGMQWIGQDGRYINTVSENIDSYIHPDYASKPWPDEQKRHATMVRRIDDGIGDLMQLLKDLKIDQETLVVFTSDNGPHTESYGYGPYQPTFFDSYGSMDGIKRDVWEGGIRVPLIARWPGHIGAGRGDDTPSGFHDWLPTLAELAAVPAPANTDGVSLLPTLSGKGKQPASTVYIEYQVSGKTPVFEEFLPAHRGQAHGEMQVIYQDGYKGIRVNLKSSQDDFQIYDTRVDAQERKNLAGSSPYFQRLQERMKDRVLQLRRPDTSAVRPYDRDLMPALGQIRATKQGVSYRVYEDTSPWTPLTASLRKGPIKSGVSEGLNVGILTPDKGMVIEFQGLLAVPEDGEYTFALQTDQGAVMRLHEATILDAGRQIRSGHSLSATVRLAKGMHPVSLVYASGLTKVPTLTVRWSGPGFGAKPLALYQNPTGSVSN